MPLVKPTLETQLAKAFNDALAVFMDKMSSSGSVPSAIASARSAAASKFGSEASTAIDAYIKSATIIVPPGQALLAGTYPGVTNAPSPPATIS